MRNLFLVLSAALLVPGCGSGAFPYELDSKSFDAKTLQTIQSDTGIILPTTAKGLNFYYKPPIDPAFIAKIQFPLSSKEDVIKALSKIENNENNGTTDTLGTNVKWWISKDTKPMIDRKTFDSSGNYLRVIVTEESTNIILYIEWWVI